MHQVFTLFPSGNSSQFQSLFSIWSVCWITFSHLSTCVSVNLYGLNKDTVAFEITNGKSITRLHLGYLSIAQQNQPQRYVHAHTHTHTYTHTVVHFDVLLTTLVLAGICDLIYLDVFFWFIMSCLPITITCTKPPTHTVITCPNGGIYVAVTDRTREEVHSSHGWSSLHVTFIDKATHVAGHSFGFGLPSAREPRRLAHQFWFVQSGNIVGWIVTVDWRCAEGVNSPR